MQVILRYPVMTMRGERTRDSVTQGVRCSRARCEKLCVSTYIVTWISANNHGVKDGLAESRSNRGANSQNAIL